MKTYVGRMLTIVNTVLAILLVIFHFTDYSLAGWVPDMIFPLLVGLIALRSWSIMRNGIPSPMTFLTPLTLWINIILGVVPYILLIIFSPIMCYGYLFIVHDYADDRIVQRELSPNQKIAAEVIYHPTGVLSSGLGAYRVTLSRNIIPFVERDIYSTSSDYYGTESTFVEWIDNDTLYIPENDEVIEIGLVDFSVSNILICSFFPILIFITYLANLFI